MHAGEERARERGEGAPEADDEAEPPRTAPEVVLNTSIGPFTVELYWKHAPKTCQNFLELAKSIASVPRNDADKPLTTEPLERVVIARE